MKTKANSQKSQKVKKQITYTMGEKAMQRLKDEITDDAVKKASLMFIAYIMDEYDYDTDKLVELFLGIERYLNAMNEHLISAEKVRSIIKERTGLDIQW